MSRFVLPAGVNARRSRRAVVALALAAIAAPVLTAGGTEARDYDCKDFKTQRQAQRFFKKHDGSRHNDPYGLDADHDGKACESLP